MSEPQRVPSKGHTRNKSSVVGKQHIPAIAISPYHFFHNQVVGWTPEAL